MRQWTVQGICALSKRSDVYLALARANNAGLNLAALSTLPRIIGTTTITCGGTPLRLLVMAAGRHIEKRRCQCQTNTGQVLRRMQACPLATDDDQQHTAKGPPAQPPPACRARSTSRRRCLRPAQAGSMAAAPNAQRQNTTEAAGKRTCERLGPSGSELAKRTGIAESTLSQLEADTGNPSQETLWALAMALDDQVTRRIDQQQNHIKVIRANEGSTLASEQTQAHYAVTRRTNCPAGVQRDLYRLAVEPSAPRLSEPHPPGTSEHVVLCRGRVRLRPPEHPVELSSNDCASYPVDKNHLFEVLVAGTTAVMLIEHT